MAGVPDHEHAVEVVRAILAMADALGIGAVADGVESDQQVACLVDLGVAPPRATCSPPRCPQSNCPPC